VFKIRKERSGVGKRHEVIDLMIQIMLDGHVQDSWLTGNNHQILPTETQKNTCARLDVACLAASTETWFGTGYVAALNNEYDCAEEYAVALANDILRRHTHIQVR
jgi:urate oxidase